MPNIVQECGVGRRDVMRGIAVSSEATVERGEARRRAIRHYGQSKAKRGEAGRGGARLGGVGRSRARRSGTGRGGASEAESRAPSEQVRRGEDGME